MVNLPVTSITLPNLLMNVRHFGLPQTVCLAVVVCGLPAAFDCKTVVVNAAGPAASQQDHRNPPTANVAANQMPETRPATANRVLHARQVPAALLEIPVISPPLRVYPAGTLKMYPFTLENTNYPTYFPYAYPGYAGYTYFQ